MAGPFQFPPLVRGGRRSIEDLGFYILPQVFTPRNATFLDQSRDATVPAGIPGVPGTVLAFEYLTPPNRRGILRRLGVDAADPAALPSLSFSIQRSGAPVPNYQGVELPLGSVDSPDEVYVEFDREQLLQVWLFNTSGFAFEADVRVVAWFWDIQVEAGR